GRQISFARQSADCVARAGGEFGDASRLWAHAQRKGTKRPGELFVAQCKERAKKAGTKRRGRRRVSYAFGRVPGKRGLPGDSVGLYSSEPEAAAVKVSLKSSWFLSMSRYSMRSVAWSRYNRT